MDVRRLAELVRTRCLEAALAASHDAGLQGLCPEGRWEMAVDAVRRLDTARLLDRPTGDDSGSDT